MLLGDLGQRVAGLHAVDAEADVVGHDARAENDRNDHLVQFFAASGSAFLEHLDEDAVELERGGADRGCDLILAVLAGAAAGMDRAGALVVAVMDAPREHRLETLAEAAEQDRIADDVERFWLLDRDGHGSSAPSLAARRLT